MPERADPHGLGAGRAKVHLDALVVGVPPRDVLEGSEVELGAELAVEHLEDVQIELRGDALVIVVGALQHRGVLNEVRAEQQRVAGCERVVKRPQERGALARADRGAEEGDEPPAAAGQQAEVALEVADDGVDADPRIVRGDLLGALAQHRLAHVEGNEPFQLVAVAERVEQDPRLSGRSGSDLDKCVGLRERGDAVGDRLQDLPLGTREVVLRQARDLVE
ncbi:MAG: hypothetical protein WD689_01190 [Gaiellaceae bacterium]